MRQKILIACECSGRIRDAFISRGFDAMSCDLKPSEVSGPHYQGSVFDIVGDGYSLMIAHPPCTYLSYAGTSSWNLPGRCEKRLAALDFFRKLYEAPIPHICIENPKGCASPTIAKYSQEIQPFYFGNSAYKTTWLWLRNLPPLIHIRVPDLFSDITHVPPPEPIYIDKSGKRRHFVDSFSGTSKSTQTERARTFEGIACAMAEQWGAFLDKESGFTSANTRSLSAGGV
jgi:hypothetical protein